MLGLPRQADFNGTKACAATLQDDRVALRALQGWDDRVEHDIDRRRYTVTDVANLRRYNAGDLISGGLQSSRSVRLAGFQVTTDFSVRPDLVTYPVPPSSGSAAVPSTVDILINSSKVGEWRVAAGTSPNREPRSSTAAGPSALSFAMPWGANRGQASMSTV
ncbi:MAG: hypothetical protein ACRYG4_21855 [Janthinobacterium lividum]